MNEVCRLHQMAFTDLTVTQWHQSSNRGVEGQIRYVDPIVRGYQMAAQMGTKFWLLIDPVLECQLLGSHLLMSRVLQAESSDEGDKWKSAQKLNKPYDIYHDPCVAEAVKCRPLLEKFINRVNALLSEWPDHPTLKQLIIILQRILNFPVTSPLMKFITGLEILLQKAHEWESNAARHVSLSEQMTDITSQIIEWRKLELRCWQSCLDTVQWQAKQKTSKWWFYLYNLLEKYMTPRKSSTLKEVTSDEEVGEMAAVLQQFMEGAVLGEYTMRLRMLESFHYQLMRVNESSKSGKIERLLWNLHQHFAQFVPNIEAEISWLKSPIEKELKGFVKIARWNDINYYAVKQTVDKTHKTLHKSMKAFQTVLQRPVCPLLTEDTKADWTASSQSDSEKVTFTVIDISAYVEQLTVVAAVCPSELQTELHHRLPSLTKQFIKHCRSIMSASKYSRYSGALDEFTGEVIETVHQLQALSVTKNEEKAKQKSEAKFIQQRKRKALADLFKYLQSQGLSYKKGLNALSQRAVDSKTWLMAEPLDIRSALQQLERLRCDADMEQVWPDCVRYYRRCISRRVLFHTALHSPSQELGIANINRCKGFSEHLTQVIFKQRSQLTEHFSAFFKLRKYMSCLSLLPEDSPCPQSSTRHWLRTLKVLCDQTLDGLRQTILVLECCPKLSADGSTGCNSPFPSWYHCQIMNDKEELPVVITKLQECLPVLTKIKMFVDKTTTDDMFITSDTVQKMSEYFSEMLQIADMLSAICDGFRLPQSGDIHPLSKTLHFIQSQISTAFSQFCDWLNIIQSWQSDLGEQSLSEFGKMVDEVVTEMLLVVQKFVHNLTEDDKDISVNSEDGKDDENQDMDLVDGHIVEHLYKRLIHRLQIVKVTKVVDSIVHIISRLVEWSNSEQTFSICKAASKLLSDCVPLIRQYCNLVQSILMEVVCSHRSLTKLLSVLLAVFTELTQKGFCLPGDLSDELSGDGATKFEDTEGGGIGEGEGVKDVSDQIETEDQLEDVHREGEEQKQPEDQNDEPDIKSEDNAIEMSEEFGGKTHDLNDDNNDSEDNNEDDDDDDDELDLDKQMGDLGDDEADKLDEQIWGSDEEEEEEQNEEKKEESGPGAGQQSETELVANEDNKDKTEADERDKQEDKQQEDSSEINKQQMMDQSEYNEDEIDPHYDDKSQQQEAEDMELPDDLNLDDKEEGNNEDEDEMEADEVNPEDIDQVLDDVAEEEAAETEKDQQQQEGSDKDTEMEVEDDSDRKDGQEEEQKPEEAGSEGDEEREGMNNEEQDGVKPDEQQGLEAKDDNNEDLSANTEQKLKPEDLPQTADYSAKTEHVSTDAEQSETAAAAAGENNQEQENEGVGLANAEDDKGHQGQDSTSVTRGSSNEKQTKQSERRPGQSSDNRVTGSTEEKVHRRLHTKDSVQSAPQQDTETRQSDIYEHIKEAAGHHDAQTLDVATTDQQQAVPNLSDEEADILDENEQMEADDSKSINEQNDSDTLPSAKLQKPSNRTDEKQKTDVQDVDDANMEAEIDGEKVQTTTVARGQESSINTDIDLFYAMQSEKVDLEKLRSELEEGLDQLTLSMSTNVEQEAQETWSKYEVLTSSLSQELCEQLRLVLEPTQASKLKGDYRTGKRLNMRKVIPYIASQFRKDKIWLRRTKPSKRQYQIMIAIDDSSSMADNHSKQLAFESLAVISNALSLLEVGELAICSFGESVKLLHGFQDQFSSQSGARILQQFTFEQKKTKIAELLNQVTSTMMAARSRRHAVQTTDISQLLLVVSDGRGLFLEGMEVVKSAVRRAKEANVFLVFVVLDNPDNKDSILDIRVPVFKTPGQLPEIKSYMDHFPFPFYIILHDINSLPVTLSDALRQWFELVTANDR